MFLLNGNPQSLDVAFIDAEGIQRPANWIRSASIEEREAVGITEAADAPFYDQRYCWGYDAEGELLWKDRDQLITQWVDQTKTTANTLLAPTDWMVIREADNGTQCPAGIRAWREAIRIATGLKIAEIEDSVDSAELAEYLVGGDYHVWPTNQDEAPPSFDEPVPVEDMISFSNSVTSSF